MSIPRTRPRPAAPGLPAAADPIHQRIVATVDSIPRGRVASYGQVALEAGLPRRARLVGRVLSSLPQGSKLAWHRVVNAAGLISTSGAVAREQRRRLRAEGVPVDVRGRVDLAEHGWRP
ncbi:MAG: MGMT family protein [Planctomycetota bacterium]|nr:MGMT family protein [Planctomycetota bacterium]